MAITFPEHFFDEEERSGYLVSHKMKKVWGVQLDLLSELLRVCKKHDIQVTAYAGTILGAVRHRGFIPWDDDVDVALTRKNYEKLLAVAGTEFSSPYFFQTALSDRDFFFGYARLRNSETTGLITNNNSINYNNGIYIDVFVLDGYTENDLKYNIQRTTLRILAKWASQYYVDLSTKLGVKKAFSYIAKNTICRVIPYETAVKIYQETLAWYTPQTERRTFVTHPFFLASKYWCTEGELSDLIYVPFENLEIPIPRNYHEILSRMYGDYMQFPPLEARGAWHEGVLEFDPDVPYQEYMKRRMNDISRG